jgi:hypothetical protein
MIRPGDVVRVGGELPLTGEVLETSREGARRGHLILRPVCRGHELVRRDVLVRDVDVHWRRVRARNGA